MKKELKFLRGVISVKQEENKITVVASDETLDRHGDVLPIENWDLSKFKSAPRMLVDHDHQVSSIVGKWENVRIEGKQLLMEANFHNITELSRAVAEMVKQAYLDTVSVGFIYHGPKQDGGHDTFELIETSWVTVPANPSAKVQASLKSLQEKTLTDEETAKVKDYLGKDLEEDEEVAEDDDEEKLGDEDEEEEVAGDDDEKEITPEKLMEHFGITPCKTVEEVKKVKSGIVVVEASLILKLLADSEKLLTLTQAGQASFQNRLLKESFKEAARMINHSLRELNKVV